MSSLLQERPGKRKAEASVTAEAKVAPGGDSLLDISENSAAGQEQIATLA